MVLELEYEWECWYDHAVSGRSAQNYEDTLHKVCTLRSVEEFWGCYAHLSGIHALGPKCGYHFMKKGVKPMWEHPQNKEGGIWQFKVPKESAQTVWKDFLISVIGHSYSEFLKEQVNGISITNRQGEFYINMWVDSQDPQNGVANWFAEQTQVPAKSVFKTCFSLIKSYKS